MTPRRAIALAILVGGAVWLCLLVRHGRQPSESSGLGSPDLGGRPAPQRVPTQVSTSSVSASAASIAESAPDAITAARPMKAPTVPITPPVADTPESSSLPPATILENMRTTIRQYAAAFGENPVGTNPEITGALQGANPKQINFLKEDGNRVNANGELVDAWGTPYFFHQISGHEMEIRSAGPDRVMYTADDLVTK